jgi:uncharacterized protein
MLVLRTILPRRRYANGLQKISQIVWQYKFLPLALTISITCAWPGIAATNKPKPITEKSLMWEVTGNGLNQPSYLFGTIHVNCKNRLKFSAKRQEIFAKAQQIYLELDFDDPTLQTQISQNTQMPPGKNLQKLLTPKQYKQARKYFADKLKLPLDFFSTTRPFILTSLATPSGLKCQVNSWEEVIVRMAKQKKIELKGLEGVKDQFAVFNTVSLKEEAAMLMDAINNPIKNKQEFLKLIAAYNNEDLNLLETITKADPSSKKFITSLLDNRNRKWIPIITREAKSKSTFFGFGAAHLVGSEGVISLLQKAGYTVKPIKG